jgi:hypothetical protein
MEEKDGRKDAGACELFKSGQWRGKWTNWTLKGIVFDTEE